MYKIILISAYVAAYFAIVGVFAAMQKINDLRKFKAFKKKAARKRAKLARNNWKRDLLNCSREFSAWVNTPRLNATNEIEK